MDANLRSYESRDRGALLALSRRALAREEEQVGAPLWASEEELDAELAGLGYRPADTLRVIEEEGEAVAFGGIVVADGATLMGPLVAPRFRGRAFGRSLLEASIELARERRLELLAASLGAHNIGGRLLLERAGFRPSGALQAVYRILPDAHRAIPRPSEGVTSRMAETADVERVLAICNECFAPGTSSEESWRQAIERRQVRLAEQAGEPIALVRVDLANRRVFHGVTAAARARGIGGYVLSEALEEYWRLRPGTPLRLMAPAANVAASRIYRRQGLVPWLLLQLFELAL